MENCLEKEILWNQGNHIKHDYTRLRTAMFLVVDLSVACIICSNENNSIGPKGQENDEVWQKMVWQY